MSIQIQKFLVPALLLLLLKLADASADTGAQLSADDLTALEAVETVVQIGHQFPDSLWPGYNLNQAPFIVYVPDRWALLVNGPSSASGFTDYPVEWPRLKTHVLFHDGQLGGLSGQLGFNTKIDSTVCAAVGFFRRDHRSFFEYIVHENFHQFQFGQFGDIPWAREELYPIEDALNTALAGLEIRLLSDAMRFLKQAGDDSLRHVAAQFTALRLQRWQQADPYVRRYEQGQEINEGTAKYVEMKAVSLLPALTLNSWAQESVSTTAPEQDSFTMADRLMTKLNEMIAQGAIQPEDMPRNRIYPVGAAQGLLLDYFGVDWKPLAQQAGPSYTFIGLLSAALNVDSTRFDRLVGEAKLRYDYDAILQASEKAIGEYRAGFVRDSAVFDSQAGTRVELCLSGRNLRRSRNSSAKKWLVDDGSKELRNHFDVYVLESAAGDDLFFCLKKAGLLELNDWSTREKTVVFHCPEITVCAVDGKPEKLAKGVDCQFSSLILKGTNFEIDTAHGGKLLVNERGVVINLLP